MELDKQTIRALSADTRIDILKSLKSRRKMPAELAKELNLAPSTIAEHLKNLESVGLVQKKDTGHKWIYYELSAKGSNIVQPRYPVNILLTLGIGLIFIIGGFSYYLTSGFQTQLTSPGTETIVEQKQISEVQQAVAKPTSPEEVLTSSQIIPQAGLPEATKIEELKIKKIDLPLISIMIITIGILLVVFGSWKLKKSGKSLTVSSVNL